MLKQITADYEYYLNADLHGFEGKWIAILRKKVIASGDSFNDVAMEAEKLAGSVRPLFAHVPSKVAEIL